MSDALRKKMLEQEPLLPLIEEAIDRYRRNVSEQVQNPENGKLLLVENDEDLGVLNVMYEGRSIYRSRYKTEHRS